MLIAVEQRSTEWLQMRAGSCTASRVGDVIAKLSKASKNGKAGEPKASRAAYMKELVCERLTGLTSDHYVSPYMEVGIDSEELARAAYESKFDVETQDGGYAMHPTIEWFGASPDFLCGDDGCGEIKCLKAENHLAILRGGVIPDEYLPQMIGELACTERKWNDFVSYNKDFPKGMKLFVRRLWRDEKVEAVIAAMEEEVIAFLKETADFLAEIKAKNLEEIGQL